MLSIRSDDQDTKTWLLQAARTILACGLAFMLSKLLGLLDGYWALVTAVIVTQPSLDDTIAAGRDRVVGTLVGAAVGFAVVEAIHRGAPALSSFWIALVPLALMTAAWPNLRLSCVTLIIVVLVPNTGAAIERPFDRVVEILLGTLASIAVSAAMAWVGRTIEGSGSEASG